MISSDTKAICKCIGELTREIYLLRQIIEKSFIEAQIEEFEIDGKEIAPPPFG